MPIANAIVQMGFVNAYDENGGLIASYPVGIDPHDGLTGYTSTTVNVRQGDFVLTYNEKGAIIASTPC